MNEDRLCDSYREWSRRAGLARSSKERLTRALASIDRMIAKQGVLLSVLASAREAGDGDVEMELMQNRVNRLLLLVKMLVLKEMGAPGDYSGVSKKDLILARDFWNHLQEQVKSARRDGVR